MISVKHIYEEMPLKQISKYLDSDLNIYSVFAVYKILGNTENRCRFEDMKVFNSLNEAKTYISSLSPYEECYPVDKKMNIENNWTSFKSRQRLTFLDQNLPYNKFGGFQIVEKFIKTSSTVRGFHMNDWIKNRTDLHLKVKDLDDWSIGTDKSLVVFDGNYEEYGLWCNYNDYMDYKPSELFQYNKQTITYLGNQEWESKTDCIPPKDIQFYVTLNKKTCWRNWEEILEDNPEFKYEDLDKNTPIGWRGYCMLWEDIEKCEDMLYYFY